VFDNLLTTEQREGRAHAIFDLAIGYPVLPVQEYIEEHLSLWVRHSLSRSSLAQTGPWRGAEPSVLLNDAISKIIDIPEEFRRFIEVTFSGSIAVQRSVVATQRIAKDRGFNKVKYILLEPCVDFYRSILSELSVDYVSISRTTSDGESDWVSLILDELKKISSQDGVMPVLMLDSPSNPEGIIASPDQMNSVMIRLNEHKGLLLADHCFAVAGVHDPKKTTFAFSGPSPRCEWISIWDTGKTFDLNGDKIGVLISSSEYVHDFVLSALETIQVTPAGRDLLFFSQFLSHPIADELVNVLNVESTKNCNFLESITSESNFVKPAGGTFAMLTLEDSPLTSIETRRRLLSRGVAVASGASFTTHRRDDPKFIRISFARPHEVFVEASSRLFPIPQ